jgi:hypothetical protein
MALGGVVRRIKETMCVRAEYTCVCVCVCVCMYACVILQLAEAAVLSMLMRLWKGCTADVPSEERERRRRGSTCLPCTDLSDVDDLTMLSHSKGLAAKQPMSTDVSKKSSHGACGLNNDRPNREAICR